MEHRRWASLDVLRGAAALAVFAFHFVGLSSPWAHHESGWREFERLAGFGGSLGTNLLLLLCGFLIGKAELENAEGYWTQLSKRAVRIYVPYVFWIFAALFVWGLFPVFAKAHEGANDIGYVLRQLVLIPGLFTDRPILTVSWTLSFVFAGYCLLPALAWVWRRTPRGGVGLSWLWLACLIVMILLGATGITSIRMAYIPMGALLSDLILDKGMRSGNWRSTLLAFGMAMILLWIRFVIQQAGSVSQGGSILFAVCGIGATSFVTFALFSSEMFLQRRFLSVPSRLLRAVGRRGYSFYLLHGAVIKITVYGLAALWKSQPWPIWLSICSMAGCLAVTYVVSHCSHRLIEQEATGLLFAMIHRRRGPSHYPLAAN